MTIEKITNSKDLTKLLRVAGGYLVENGFGEVTVTCGKFRVKVVVDLIDEEDITE